MVGWPGGSRSSSKCMISALWFMRVRSFSLVFAVVAFLLAARRSRRSVSVLAMAEKRKEYHASWFACWTLRGLARDALSQLHGGVAAVTDLLPEGFHRIVPARALDSGH